MILPTRTIGPFTVSAIGLGCMGMSHAFGPPPPREQSRTTLLRALELGCTFFDTAAIYGVGHNEELVAEVLGPHRSQFTLASKCGLFVTKDGGREINGKPETLKATLEDSLRRLNTEVIDLYYLHRWDKRVPIEESVGALKDMVGEGKVRAIGLSEVSAATLRRAHAVHPIAALQSEYSPWTRNAELGALEACAELGTAYVAFSPVARGFLAGGVPDPEALAKGDLRRGMPRFQGENFAENVKLYDAFAGIAHEADCTPAQLCLAWLLAKAPHIVPIPGTTRVDHLEEDFAALDVTLSPAIIAKIDATVNESTVRGNRYPDAMEQSVDTERFGG
jgi:aryl-alcohol dehydrogenase-like predicted oxidoreductase